MFFDNVNVCNKIYNLGSPSPYRYKFVINAVERFNTYFAKNNLSIDEFKATLLFMSDDEKRKAMVKISGVYMSGIFVDYLHVA